MNNSVCAGFIDKGQLYITHCWIRFALAVKNIHYKFFPQKHHLIVVITILNTNIITSPFVLFAEILQYKLNYEGQIENTSLCAQNNKNNTKTLPRRWLLVEKTGHMAVEIEMLLPKSFHPLEESTLASHFHR